MDCEILPPTNDFVFKLLFGDNRHKSILINMLKSFVDLPDEEFELVFLNPFLYPEHEKDKMGILDIKVSTKTGKIIGIEIQVNPQSYIGERISYYKSKLITDQISEGEKYNKIQRVICVCITDHVIHKEDQRYLNYFCFCNPETGLCFKGIPEEIFTLEIPKLPAQNDGNKVWEWLQFLRSKQRGEFEMIAEANPEIRKAVDLLYEISADDRAREEYNSRQLAWMDRQVQFDGYFEKGIEKGIEKGRAEERTEVARKFKSLGFSLEQIQAGTGLSLDEIAAL